MQSDNPKLKIKKTKELEKELEEIKKQLEEFKKQFEEVKKSEQEYKNKYLRALADYQNFEKRVNEEKIKWQSRVKKELIAKILPIIDNLERAEVFIKDAGLKLVKEQFYKFLRDEEVVEIEILGKEFDPFLAEAVEIISGDKDNIVVEVVKKGYRLKDEVLRPAQVKVSKVNTNRK